MISMYFLMFVWETFPFSLPNCMAEGITNSMTFFLSPLAVLLKIAEFLHMSVK